MAHRKFAKTMLLGGALSFVLSVSMAEAQRGGGRGGGGARASAAGGGARSAPMSVNSGNRGGNVNRGGGNVNRGGGNTVNNVNVNRNVAVAGGGYNNGCCNGGYDNDGYHPVAAAMVVGATAAVVSNAVAPKPVVVAPY